MINVYHAHVYFDATSKPQAQHFHELIGKAFPGHSLSYFGNLLERCVGPHPQWMFEINFVPAMFATVVQFLALHHGTLSVLIHPETMEEDNGLNDHTIYAMWLGKQLELNPNYIF